MKILVVQTAFIGDVILATPVLEALHRQFPDAQLDFLLRAGNESLLKGHPFVREVLVWQKKQHKYRNWFHLLKKIRAERYDWVINCQRFAAAGLLTALSGAGHTTGFDKNPFSRFFTHRFPHRIGEAHEVDRNLSLLEPLTGPVKALPRLYPTPADEARAHAVAGDDTPYICMAPTSVWFTKQLPAHKWVELINQAPPEVRIFLLGGPADHAACEAIRTQAHHPQVVNTCGQLSLPASAALMRNARRNFVNDSAPMHLASAVDAPVTAFFCSTIPAFGFTPLSSDSQVLESEIPLDCRPCGLHGFKSCPKGHFRCGEEIKLNGLIK